MITLFFRFINTEDLHRVLLDGPWLLDDAVLALGAWTLEFQPSAGLLPRATIWMRSPKLPPAL